MPQVIVPKVQATILSAPLRKGIRIQNLHMILICIMALGT
jgi:hypothetical protein